MSESHNQEGKPSSVVTRAPFVVRNYYQGVGLGSGARVWCEVEIAGKPFHPFADAIHGFSISPAANPVAGTLVMEGGANQGLYLVRLEGERPLVQKLGDKASFDGFWAQDGATYVHGAKAIDVRSGKSRELPKYLGDFLALSPDGGTLLSYSLGARAPFDEITLHEIDTSTGADHPRVVKRVEYPWLLDDTHPIAGAVESTHLWKASHVEWIAAGNGRYHALLPPPTR